MTKEASTMSIDSGKYIQQDNTSRASTLLAFQISPFATHLDTIPSTETNRVHFMLLCSGSTLLHSLSHGLLFWYDKGAPVGLLASLTFTNTKMLIGGLNCKTQKQVTYCTQMNAVAAFPGLSGTCSFLLLITFVLII
ncbi:hypothetical protein C8J56DRAFT_964219, partial [Mycena floridula]